MGELPVLTSQILTADIQETTNLVKLISEYGIMVVICAVMIGFFIILFKAQQKRYDTLFNKLLENTNKQVHPEDEHVDLLASINDQIHDRLSALLTSSNADRSFLFLYHNGGVSNSGLYFQKMSCISEVVSQGILPLSKDCQALHQSTYKGLCSKLRKDGVYVITDANQLIGVDDILYNEMCTRKTRASVFIALKNTKKQVIGFFGMDFGFNPEASKALDVQMLIEESHELSVLVNIKNDVE